MTPYWNQIDAQLERSARYLFTFCGVAVGCQGVETLGHILKVLAHYSGYDPEKFLLKLADSVSSGSQSIMALWSSSVVLMRVKEMLVK